MVEKDFDSLDQQLLSANGKIIHQCFYFLYDSKPPYPPLPLEFQEKFNSWSDLNPNWKHVLWTPELSLACVEKYYGQYSELYKSFPKPIQRSDFMRYCVLHRYGGVYADMDTTCKKSMDELLTLSNSQSVGLSNDPLYQVANCFMVSKTSQHPFWPAILKEIQNNYSPQLSVLKSTGPAMMQNFLFKKLQWQNISEQVGIYPTSIVCWKGIGSLKNFWKTKKDEKTAFVIHHNDISWRKGFLFDTYRKIAKRGILSPLILLLIIIVLLIVITTTLKKSRYLSCVECKA